MQSPTDENRELSPVEKALAAMFAAVAVIVGASLIAWISETYGDPGIYALGAGVGALVLVGYVVTR